MRFAKPAVGIAALLLMVGLMIGAGAASTTDQTPAASSVDAQDTLTQSDRLLQQDNGTGGGDDGDGSDDGSDGGDGGDGNDGSDDSGSGDDGAGSGGDGGSGDGSAEMPEGGTDSGHAILKPLNNLLVFLWDTAELIGLIILAVGVTVYSTGTGGNRSQVGLALSIKGAALFVLSLVWPLLQATLESFAVGAASAAPLFNKLVEWLMVLSPV